MHKTLASLTAIAVATASLSAQCVAPTGAQNLSTTYFGTTFYAAATPPLYGVSLDPGVAIRCNLAVNANINITAVGSNFLNDGFTYATVPCPNLVGAPNGTCEVWVVPNDTVLNPALFTANAYTHNPSVPPIAPWTHLSTAATHVSNLVFAAPDTPSTATFNPPLALAAGNYAVVFVFVPQGVATLPPGTGIPANAVTDRIHPLFTNLTSQPGPSTYSDGFITISNPGVISPAFANGALSPASTPTPFMPNFNITYTLGAQLAYQTPYGVGCYDRKQSFYESFAATPVVNGGPIDLQNSAISMFNVGNNYIASTGASTFPFNGTVPGSTLYYSGLGPTTPTQVNTGAPGVALFGDWDDSVSVAYPLPFPFSYAGDGGVPATAIRIGSNGAIWLSGTAPTSLTFNGGYAGWLLGPPSIAGAFMDLWPADLSTFQGGTGNIFADSDGASYVTITWSGVREYPNTANNSANNNFQITLQAGGGVELTYGSVRNGNSSLLVGFTPGNGAADPGTGATPRQAPDLSVAIAGPGYVSGDGAAPSVISLANRPNSGAPLIINTNNIDPTAPINITLISASSLPGIDLAGIGMGGCSAWINLPEIASFLSLVGGGSASWPALASIPPSFAGVDLYAQSAQLATGFPVSYNSANILVSSAVCIHFDLF